MRLFRYGKIGEEFPGVMVNDVHYDVRGFGEDFTPAFFAADGITRLRHYFDENESILPKVEMTKERFGTPITQPGKIVCVGLNYEDHVKETGLQQQEEPILFLKANSAFNGPFDGVTIPRGSKKTDWETELAIVIGKKMLYTEESDVMDCIAGYILHNDITERAFQTERGGTWDKGKGCDTFAPMGPYMVTTDEIEDVNNLRVWLKLNGVYMQDSNTKHFIRKIPELLSYTSNFTSLNPGDVFSTGSPAGAGMGKTPPLYLKDGDVIEYGIDGLGTAKQLIFAYKEG